MPFERFLTQHTIWLDLLTAVGTVSATVIALVVSIHAAWGQRREKLSGLAIREVDPCGVAFLENTSRVQQHLCIYKNDTLIDPERKIFPYSKLLDLAHLKKLEWPIWREITLSAGEGVAIHLKDIVIEDTFVALVGLRVRVGRSNKYSVYRYAGDNAARDPDVRPFTHPHHRWVLEFQRVV